LNLQSAKQQTTPKPATKLLKFENNTTTNLTHKAELQIAKTTKHQHQIFSQS
jgi:hypothetical protein